MAARKHAGAILGTCVALVAGSLGAGWLLLPADEMVGFALRATARITLGFFLLAYLARPLAKLSRHSLT